MDETTGVFLNYCHGDNDALNRLLPVIYEELRLLARNRMRHERTDHTLQTTALIHEAYVRLIDQRRVTWQSRSHFLGIAAQAMRRILVDHARSRLADKRDWARILRCHESNRHGQIGGFSII
ncbi:MAG: ECF-type sigma factor [Candidatus Eisenbacteria bacterium]|nr:ECF-type sigma factor [Candidatus Eisenbacteria bacterium]